MEKAQTDSFFTTMASPLLSSRKQEEF